jgi:RimJ/RimL family protein N-acetyltransferase
MIETQRLKILPFNESFISQKYLAWLNDKELLKYSEQRRYTHDYNSSLSYIKSFENSKNVLAAIFLKDSGAHIGNINAYIDVHNKVADMGILIGDPIVQGKGIGLEAWISLMYYIFQKNDVRKITAGTMALNTAMLKIMDSSGMHRETIKDKQFLVGATEVDLISSAIFKDEFNSIAKQDGKIASILSETSFTA